MELDFTFYTIAAAIIKLFVLMLIGYVLYYRRIIDDKFTDTLSMLLVRVIFPALIITKTITHFSFSEYANWWFLPLAAIIFSFVGMLIGAIIGGGLKDFDSRKEFMCSTAFQNCGYLPMNLILFLFAGTIADRLLVYLFLYIVGFNLLMWSLLPLFLSGNLKKGFNPRMLLTPPVVATVFSLLWVAFFGNQSMPAVLIDPVGQLGNAAFPIAMLTLGAYLCRYRGHDPRNRTAAVSCVIAKLLLFPVLIFAVLFFIPLSHDYKFFLFLESIMPTAVSLVVVGSYSGADNRFFSNSIFYTHVIAILSIPVWLVVFQMFMK